jgi:hypothetical protein
MMPLADSAVRVSALQVAWVADRLAARDWAIALSVARLRLVTSGQLERLHFAELAGTSRSRIRRRVLVRLVAWRVLVTFERRVGGERAGSSGLVFALGAVGLRLLRPDDAGRRSDGVLAGVLAPHTLQASELYVRLMERARRGDFRLDAFDTEPACWRPLVPRGWLKPDAYLSLVSPRYQDQWFVEIDLGTEHLPVIRRKCEVYLDYLRRGRREPDEVMPRVVWSVPDEKRRADLSGVVSTVKGTPDGLFEVVTHERAAARLVEILLE